MLADKYIITQIKYQKQKKKMEMHKQTKQIRVQQQIMFIIIEKRPSLFYEVVLQCS